MRKILVLAAAAALLGSPAAGAVEIDPDNPVHVLLVARAVAIPCKITVEKSVDEMIGSVAVGEWGSGAVPAMKNIAFKVGTVFQSKTEVEKAKMCATAREILR